MIFSAALAQAVDATVEWIDSRQFTVGMTIPDTPSLCHILSLDMETADEVLRYLHSTGRLKKMGQQYVVAPKRFVRNTTMSSLSKAMETRNFTLISKVIAFDIREAPKEAAAALNLTLGALVYYLNRVRSIDNTPMVIEISYLPVQRFEGLSHYDFGGTHSLYHILDTRYNTRAEYQLMDFFIEFPSQREAEFLNIASDEPMLTLSGKTLDQNGAVFEYSITKSPGSSTCYESAPMMQAFLRKER